MDGETARQPSNEPAATRSTTVGRRGFLFGLFALLAGAPAAYAFPPQSKTSNKSPAKAAAKPPTKSNTRKRTPRGRRGPTSKPASAPASQPEEPVPPQGETVAYTLRRFQRIGIKQLKSSEIALLAGLQFCSAVAACDGARAADMLDATGYQQMPMTGPLPNPPPRPIAPLDFRESFKARSPVNLDNTLLDRFTLVRRAGMVSAFPSVAQWMLPDDHGLVIDPDPMTPGWVTRRCCLVIRVRARRPCIMAGNMVEALGVG